MAPAAVAVDLVPITVRVCAPSAMWFYVFETSDGGFDGLTFSLTSSTYTVSAQFKDWKKNADPTELRGADGCWSRQYRVPEGTMQASLRASMTKMRADACWPESFNSNPSPVDVTTGTVVELRVPEPAMLPIQVRSPEGNLVSGATVGPHVGPSPDPVNDGMYSMYVAGQTVRFSANGVNADVMMSHGFLTSPNGSCTSGSNLAFFGTPQPDLTVKGVLRYAMPDGGQQQVRFTDSLGDGTLDATLPYSVPETTVEVPGGASVSSAVAGGSPIAWTTVKGGAPAVLTGVLNDESTGAPVSNVVVIAERRDPASFQWTTVAQGRTAADGRASIRIENPISTTYRIRPTSVGTPAHLVVTVKQTRPGKVQTVKAKIGSRSVALHWKRPINTGGAPISGYRVEIRKVGAKKWTSKTFKANQLGWTPHKLAAGIKYQYRIQAVNAVGSSAWVKGTATPKA